MVKIIAIKQQMTQVFDDNGRVRPVTLMLMDNSPADASNDLRVGALVKVSGKSKGRGFQGVVKRHGFAGGPRTHGQKHSEREPGSIGGGLRTRVPKGMRMAGRTGGRQVTVSKLPVLAIDKESGQVLIGGAVPGRRGTKLELQVQ